MAGPADAKAQGSVFLCAAYFIALMRYQKPYCSVAEQLEILKSRGLACSDEVKACAWLERIGYCRLSGYAYPFRVSRTEVDGTGKTLVLVSDDFKVGTEFKHIVDLYVFDKKLRLSMLDAIERVEIGLRSAIALRIGRRDPWAHRLPAHLDGVFAKRIDRKSGLVPHKEWLDKLDATFERSNEEFAKQFRASYPHDYPPIWIATELWDFGMMSRFYAGMLYQDRTVIANLYGIPNPNILEAWLRSINFVRNVCAHHSRLWNRSLVNQGKFPRGAIPMLNHLATDTAAQSRLYGTAAAIRFLLLSINPSTSWPGRLKDILGSLPAAPGVTLARMGFPPNWDKLPLWTKIGG